VKRSESFPRSNIEVTGYFSNQLLHLPPVILSMLDNVILGYVVGKVTNLYPQLVDQHNFPNYSIEVTNFPLPYSPADKIRFSGILISPGYLLGFLTVFGYCFLVSTFVIMPIKEKDFRHIQMISGASPVLFWAANYMWNFLHFSLIAIANCCILLVVQIPSVDWKDVLYMFSLLEAYGLTSVLFMGAWSILPFRHYGLALSHTFLFHMMSGTLMLNDLDKCSVKKWNGKKVK
jgi:ATP-binding cassette subfamily A (ABC1) protein 2